ncbi:MAG: tetratricopeptide repeat protein [Ginsengibacter sp.]
MKYLITVLFFFLCLTQVQAQSNNIDSLNRLISKSTSDTQRINLKIIKLEMLGDTNLDSAIAFAKEIIVEAQKTNYKKGEANAKIRLAGNYCFTGEYALAKENLDASKEILSHITDSVALSGMYYRYGMMYSMQNKFDTSHQFYNKALVIAQGLNDKNLQSTIYQNDAIAYQQQSNYPQALTNYQNALNASEQINDEEGEAFIYLNIGITYNSLNDDARSEQSYLKAIGLAKRLGLKNVLAYSYSNLASLYEGQGNYSKEYETGMKAASLGREIRDQGIEATSLSRAAHALAQQNKFEEAEKLTQKAIQVADSSKQPYNQFQVYQTMGRILKMQNNCASAIPYLEKAFSFLKKSDIYDEEVGSSYNDLSDCYEQMGNYKMALSTYKIAAEISDSIRGRDNIKKATELTMNYDFAKKQQILKDEQVKKNDLAKARQFALIIGLILTFLLAMVAFYGFRNKRRANVLLQEEKEKVDNTLSELKSTQAQLIHSEKMASLGELTAGIAHEIQNPLNFVNNFSEVSNELIDEMNAELEKGDVIEAKEIAKELRQNLERINRHGRRAGDIVKGMLQHSRSSTGVKEPTNINALADEYLRLAYHGLRAKDKSFNSDMKTDFDESIPKINIVPQDVGRVILNLITNAFYAVKAAKLQKGNNYEPTVWVSTKKENDKILVTVKDNGTGIPASVKDKIFHPFFTTKPTGEGTGLGLSLSYDIIKTHGGLIKVQSKEGEGTEFTVEIPVA